MNNPTKLKDKGTVRVRNGRGFGGESLTIGGIDTQGNDATNDLTMLMLEASVHTRMMNRGYVYVCTKHALRAQSQSYRMYPCRLRSPETV
ncbi:pyruvate formate-lyase [Photobacterium aphoticum]|uniref:Pyruvate formate-lyase n=1 Tax=Photobacterium aphoticum TaxID=754436 RepID=A0A090QLL5_9GAMM|nr:pyruvate formate-lyase [Photobacterium aphoticum]